MLSTAISFSPLNSPTAGIAAQAGEGGASSNLHIPDLVAENVISVGGFNITNTMIVTTIVAFILAVVGIWIGRSVKVVPDGKQNFAEWVLESILGIVEQSAGARVGRKIFPLIATLFIFIICAYWTEVIPGFETLTWQASSDSARVPILRSPPSDLNLTLAMTFVTLVIVQVAGFSAHGFLGHLKEYRNPFNIIDEVGRVISLSVRLFANVFGGSILLAIMYGFSFLIWFTIIPIALPLIFMLFEMFIGFLQALVFALLALAYVTLAVAGSHGEGDRMESEPLSEQAMEETSPARAA